MSLAMSETTGISRTTAGLAASAWREVGAASLEFVPAALRWADEDEELALSAGGKAEECEVVEEGK